MHFDGEAQFVRRIAARHGADTHFVCTRCQMAQGEFANAGRQALPRAVMTDGIFIMHTVGMGKVHSGERECHAVVVVSQMECR